MRTTIRIHEQLLQEARQQAARQGKSLTAVTEDALRESLARQRSSGLRVRVRLKTFSGRGTLPGVNLDDSAALLDLMEAVRDPDRRECARLRPSSGCTGSYQLPDWLIEVAPPAERQALALPGYLIQIPR